MKPQEIKPLVMAAKKAFDHQANLGLVEEGETFDDWRHQQCMNVVGRPGITACNHDDFRPLLAHFQVLAGDDGSAFESLMKTGKPNGHAAPGDSHEARRVIANQIAQAIAEHERVATAVLSDLDPDAQARRARLDAKGSHIGIGYLVWLVRQKTRRPDLQLGQDWQTTLADRCTVIQLTQIRDTVINRIAAAEGTGSTAGRNKSQRRRAPRTD